ncbi:MAG: hypothetical protein M3R63_09675 [Actinomycetota bacterium]|nr:hypothetical protein [Actinomycetota bacterium]
MRIKELPDMYSHVGDRGHRCRHRGGPAEGATTVTVPGVRSGQGENDAERIVDCSQRRRGERTQ